MSTMCLFCALPLHFDDGCMDRFFYEWSRDWKDNQWRGEIPLPNQFGETWGDNQVATQLWRWIVYKQGMHQILILGGISMCTVSMHQQRIYNIWNQGRKWWERVFTSHEKQVQEVHCKLCVRVVQITYETFPYNKQYKIQTHLLSWGILQWSSTRLIERGLGCPKCKCQLNKPLLGFLVDTILTEGNHKLVNLKQGRWRSSRRTTHWMRTSWVACYLRRQW